MEYPWECEKCGETVRIERPIAKSAEGPTAKERTCKHRSYRRVYEMPGITKASYLDGTKRPGFQDAKEIARLEVKKAAANTESERKEAEKAIKSIRYSK